jgi:hypothetical protein
MLIHYENTFEEFIEASEALAARKRKKRRANSWVYTLIMVGFFLAAEWIYQTVGHVNHFLVTFHLFAPIAFSFAIVAVVLCVSSLMAGRLPRGALRAAFRLGIFLLALSPVFLVYKLLSTINPRSPRFIWRWTLLLPHTTWLFFVAWISIMTVKSQRNKTKVLWNEQPSLHRAKSADISAEGVVITDMVSRSEVHWDGFVGWRETKKLFVLFYSEHRILFFPKGAFASAEELEAMRALARFIPAIAATAFPVIQPDAPSTLPPPLPARENMPI